MHYTHLTKIKAHHIHPQSYMQTLNLRGGGGKMTRRKTKVNISWKYHTRTHNTHTHTHARTHARTHAARMHTHIHTNLKLYNSKEGKNNNNILYISCQAVWRARRRRRRRKKRKKKKKVKRSIQGGLASAWNAFLLNVFNSMGYLRWWAKLFHAKEPEKEKLVLKISILVLGKSCLFPWTWRRSWDLSDTARLCREQPFALEHICWAIVVCLKGVVWEHSTFVCSLN